jgi:membrane-associated protease RseP (regulator of RpoE activity)
LKTPLREQLPGQIDQSDQTYRKRIQKIFNQHPEATGGNFEHFWEAQLVWDETMAESVARYLSSHPEKAMIVLAGTGHMEFGSGIPNRVRRRLPELRTAILITADKAQTKSHVTDYSLVSKTEALPPAPKMGLAMERKDGVRVKSVTPGGAAAMAGIMKDDRIVKIDTTDVKSAGDVRLALLDKQPGDRIVMRVERKNGPAKEDLTVELVLGM